MVRDKERNLKVDNAIIMAAGLSSRFAPLSYEQPKSLLKVKGEVLIERQIRQLKEAGIEDVTIVVGAKKELFHYLIEKFNVSIVENPDYQERNNHSTLYHVKDKLKNTYICSSDNYFTQNVFESYVDQAFYSSVYHEGETDEWCIETNEQGLITDFKIGGENAWVMLGHVFFTREFSEALLPLIEEAYKNEETAGYLWEEVYQQHLEQLHLYIRKYSGDVVLEFDSLEELREFDFSYIDHSRSKILETISRKLSCKERDIHAIHPIYSGDNVEGFQFDVDQTTYSYTYKTREIKQISNTTK